MKHIELNTMKSLRTLSVVVMSAALLSGCGDFGDLNVDPNNPSSAKTELLLTNAQRSVSDVVAATTPVLYVQWISETQYDDAARYSSSTFDFNGWYTGPLADLEEIIKLNSDPATAGDMISGGSNANQIAVARIMKVYFYHMMVDRWGPVPYSQALKGSANLKPGYDAQDAIYADLVAELKEAVAQMDAGVGANGDIFFDGDMDTWAQFANTLRMRIALRMSDAASGTARSEFESAAANHIAADVMYPYLAAASNENPWYSRFQTRTDYAISDVLVDYMKAIGDERLLKYAEPAPDFDDEDGVVEFSDIEGMPYDTPNPGNITNAEVSFPSRYIGAAGPGVGIQDAPLPILTVSEALFMKAEAVAKGWTVAGGTASELYEDAIQASWEQWGVYDAAKFATYMAQAGVAYNATNYKKSIGEQKWVALYPLGYEAWAEWRRLDYPQLTPHSLALNDSGEIPVRHAYPTTETQLNKENYDLGVTSLGGADDDQTKLWWDKN